MKKIIWLSLLLLTLVAGSVQAAPVAQSSGPSIERFDAALQVVDRAALRNRRVRIPVSWAAVNRPLSSNLYFEQVLPDGSAINIELPRLFPWVRSSGDGVVAPIEPFGAVSGITLRLRMVDFFTQTIYDERQINLPIGNTGDPGADFGHVPTISRFSIQSPTILRSQLGTSNGRIGVSWQATNRPLTATLVFEQVLPSGEIINVELPRSSPWVNSTGNGLVAPRDPGSNVSRVWLRLRLVDLVNGRVYDQREAIVNILTPPTPPATSIQQFNAGVSSVNAQRLAERSEYVPVSWSVINRPQNSNLVFEQMLSDGRLVNIELPRQNPIVPSSGNGVVLPRSPGGNATQITLVIRLIDLGRGSEYARRSIQLPIVGTPPNDELIASFTTSAVNVNMGKLKGGLERVPVSWSVPVRPANTNLIFEQRLRDGRIVNVELPRQNPIVPSFGTGITAPVWPGDNAQEILLLLRLVDLTTNVTLDSAEIRLPIVGNDGGGIQYGDACFGSPYGPSYGIAVGKTARVIHGDVANGLRVRNLPQGDFVETLPIGETFEVIEGPACWTIQPILPAQSDFRVWRIRTHRNNLEAWVEEYEYVVDGGRFVPYLEVLNDDGGDADPVIHNFSAEPMTVARGGSITLAWDTANASSVSIQAMQPNGQPGQLFDNLGQRGTLNYGIPQAHESSARFLLSLEDAQGRPALTDELTVTISCPFSNTLDPTRCPATQSSIQTAYQTYQNGFMVWRGDTRQIYVLYQDGSYQTFDDTWTPDQPVDTGETPPDGLILPARGFGKVWANQPGVRDRIGWATNAEGTFGATLETYSTNSASEIYLTLPDGRILVLGQGWQTR